MASTIQQRIRQRRKFRSLEEEVYVGLQLAADRVSAPWAATLKEEADLTLVQYNVLRILRGAGEEGLWASELAGRLLTRSPDVTRLVERLEKRGLVRRRRDAEDRRAVRVEITRAGLDLIAPLDRVALDALHGVLGGVGKARLESLRAGLEALLDSLDEG